MSSSSHNGCTVSKMLFALPLVVVVAASAVGQSQPGRVVGRVVDAQTGEPVRGVRLTLFPALAPPTGIPATSPLAAQRPPQAPVPRPIETNAVGVFEFEQVPNGRWRIRTQGTGYVAVFHDPPFDVSGGRVELPEIRLDRGGVITGRLLDAKGNPFSGMLVRNMQLVRMPDGTVRGGGRRH